MILQNENIINVPSNETIVCRITVTNVTEDAEEVTIIQLNQQPTFSSLFSLSYGISLAPIQYSLDSTNWINSPNSLDVFAEIVYCVAYDEEHNMWVAGSYHGTGSGDNALGYSLDGIHWVGSTNGNSVVGEESTVWGVCYAKGLGRWVACVESGDGSVSLIYSDDGMSWNQCTNGGTDVLSESYGVAFNGNVDNPLFVACGFNEGGGYTAYSADGITWTVAANVVFETYSWKVAYNGKTWIATGEGTTDYLMSSEDGENWTGLGYCGLSNVATDIAWNGWQWIATSQETETPPTVVYSNNGVDFYNWSNDIILPQGCWGVTWNGLFWLIAGFDDINNSYIYYSKDGYNWTPCQQQGWDIAPTLTYYGVRSRVQLPILGSSGQTIKSFVIDHPIDSEKYLVHACLEGPEAYVQYHGKGEAKGGRIVISLPDYAVKLCNPNSWVIQITGIGNNYNRQFTCDEVEGGKFTVYGNGKFFWQAVGTRATFEVEPLKSSVNVNGVGPYKYIQ